jgi:SAM-dependent methyltransferase
MYDPSGCMIVEMEISPWEFEWTADKVGRFWNLYSHVPGFSTRYFSRAVGHSIVRKLNRYLKPQSIVLDFGAGKGDLARLLLKSDYKVIAVDSSKKSVQALEKSIGAHPNLLQTGVVVNGLPLPSSSLDAVLLVEIIEHLHSSDLGPLLQEFMRVLRPGGILFVTTPNGENLEGAKQMCPNCACVFHPVQHLRSFTSSSLRIELEQAAFRVDRCRSTYFSHLHGLRVYTDRLRRVLGPDPLPNLFAVAIKVRD